MLDLTHIDMATDEDKLHQLGIQRRLERLGVLEATNEALESARERLESTNEKLETNVLPASKIEKLLVWAKEHGYEE